MSVGRHTYDYGVVGNCSIMAHIDKRASVVWMCLPRFDGDPAFGSLIGGKKGGHFQIRPAKDHVSSSQHYLENTNVLCTEFRCEAFGFRVIDFAPRFREFERYHRSGMLMRKVEVLYGRPQIRVEFDPVAGFGQPKPAMRIGSNHLSYDLKGNKLRLTTDLPVHLVAEGLPITLTGDRYLCLAHGAPLEAPLRSTVESFLQRTSDYWRTWVEHCRIPHIFQKEVIRSALVLKLHQFEDTGAIIASGTTSLPEAPGAGRNWDYRYCWIRDSYYVLSAFENLGHFEEMKAYSHYIENVVQEDLDILQPVYSILGKSKLTERTVDVEGYRGNQPVRFGNQAFEHRQHDVYGQALLSLLPLYVDRRFVGGVSEDSTAVIERLVKMMAKVAGEPDAGLWEFRGEARKHAYTALFHWAGAKAALMIAKRSKSGKLEAQAERLIVDAERQIEACFLKKAGIYSAAQGTKDLDASLLTLVTMGYLAPDSEAAHKLVRAVEKELAHSPGLLFRYRHADDFGEMEVCFGLCGFWHAEALAVVGEVDDALEAFRNMLRSANHLGLLSEDVEPESMSQWGNFPQTYSHVGLINAAFRIEARLERPRYFGDELFLDDSEPP